MNPEQMQTFLVFPASVLSAQPYRLDDNDSTKALTVRAGYPAYAPTVYADERHLPEGDYDLVAVRLGDGAIFRYPTVKVRFVAIRFEREVSID